MLEWEKVIPKIYSVIIYSPSVKTNTIYLCIHAVSIKK